MDRITGLAPWLVVGRLATRWATESQQQARRNAMVSATELAALRLERAEVAAYVAEAIAARQARLTAAAAPARLVG